MNRFIRLWEIIFWLSLFFVRALYIRAICKDPIKRRHRLSRNTSFISLKLLKGFDLKVKMINPQNLICLDSQNHLIVSNHVSYTDIVVLSSIHTCVFITSTEMAATPVLGDITRLGGSLMTNRVKITSLPDEINNFANALKEGFNLVLFPEGTSTNGETIMEFRKSLFQSSIAAQKPILPICIKYTMLDGKRVQTQAQRDVFCWYADMLFVTHCWELLKHNIEVEVTVLEAIPYNPAVKRQQLSDTIRNQLLAVYQA